MFSLNVTGTIEGVSQQVADLAEDPKPVANSLLENYREAIQADLKSLGGNLNGCQIILEGNASDRVRQISVQIIPRQVAL